MAVPSMSTFYAGQRLRAADMNSQVRDAVNWTISGKTCRAVRNGSQSIPNNTVTAIQFNTEDFDPLAWHDNVTLPNIVVPNMAGYYQVDAGMEFVNAAGGNREAFIRAKSFGGGPFLFAGSSQLGNATYRSRLSVSTVVYQNGSTDYVELVVFQDSGAALNTSVTSFNSYLCVTFIGT